MADRNVFRREVLGRQIVLKVCYHFRSLFDGKGFGELLAMKVIPP